MVVVSQTSNGVPLVLPRGRHAAPRAVVWASQRGRLLAAMADTVAEKGYAHASVADVIEHAGVSRKTFYEHFANKEQCFLAAYDAGVDRLFGAIRAAIDAAGSDPFDAAAAGTVSYLAVLAANPAFARTFLIEVLGAGPEALERRTAVHERFADQLVVVYDAARLSLPELPARPRHVFRACVGAINELVTDHILRRGPDSLPELSEQIREVEMGLLVGDERSERLRSQQLGAGERPLHG
jgi:AcrR family transcriptional regulator